MNQEQACVPDGIPSLLHIAQASAVIGISAVTLTGWLRRGQFRFVQLHPGMWRQVPAEEVAYIAACLGLVPDWERVFDER